MTSGLAAVLVVLSAVSARSAAPVAAQAVYESSAKSAQDLLAFCEALGSAQADAAAEEEARSALGQRVKAARDGAAQALSGGRLDFTDEDWRLLSVGWDRIPAALRGAPLDAGRQEADRLFALLAALKSSGVDLSKVSPATRRMIFDGDQPGLLGRRILSAGTSPSAAANLISRVDDIAHHPGNAQADLDRLFAEDPRAYQEFSQAVIAAPLSGGGKGSSVVTQQPKALKLDAGEVPGLTTRALPAPVFDRDRLAVGETVLGMLVQSPVTPHLGASTKAANREEVRLETQRLAQERADLLLSDLGGLADDSAAAQLLERYAKIAQAEPARRLALLEHWSSDATALLGSRPGSAAAQEKALMDEYARAAAAKDEAATVQAQKKLAAFFQAQPDRARFYADRLAFQKKNLELVKTGGLPDGTVFDPSDLGFPGSERERMRVATISGHRGLTTYVPGAPDGLETFESFDGKVARRTSRSKDGMLWTVQLKPEPAQASVLVDPKTKTVRIGGFDQERFAPQRELVDGKLARLWLTDFRAKPAREDALLKSGLTQNLFQARRLSGYARGVVASDQNVVQPPELAKGQDGKPVLRYESGDAVHVVTMQDDGALIDMTLSAKGDVASAVICHFDDVNARCTLRETYKTATAKVYDPQAPAGWYTNSRTGMRSRQYGALVDKPAVDYTSEMWDGQGYHQTAHRPPQDDGFFDSLQKQLGSDVSTIFKPVAFATDFVANRGKDAGHLFSYDMASIPTWGDDFDRLVYRDVTGMQAPIMQRVDNPGTLLMADLKKDLGPDYESFRALTLERYRENGINEASTVGSAVRASGSYGATDEELGQFLISGKAGFGSGGAGHEFARRAQVSDTWYGKTGNFLGAVGGNVVELAPQVVAFEGVGELGTLGRLSEAGETAEVGEVVEGAQTAQKLSGLARAGRVAQQTTQLAQSAYFKTMMAQQGLQLLSAHNENNYENFAELAALFVMPEGDRERKTKAFEVSPKDMISEALTTSPVGKLATGLTGRLFAPKTPEQLSFDFAEPLETRQTAQGWLAQKLQGARGLFSSGVKPESAVPEQLSLPLASETTDDVARSNRSVIDSAMEQLRQEDPDLSKAYNRIPRQAIEKAGLLGPQARLVRVLSTRGVNLICEAEVGEGSAAKRVVVKVLADAASDASDGYQERLSSFKKEAEANRRMSRLLPKGWAPEVGEGFVDVGGNPAFVMDQIRGKDVGALTSDEAALLTDERIEQAMGGIEKLRQAGLSSVDSPQLMMLTEDQVVGGVARKRGDLVFIDAANTTNEGGEFARKSEDLALELTSIKVAGEEPGSDPMAVIQKARARAALLKPVQPKAAPKTRYVDTNVLVVAKATGRPIDPPAYIPERVAQEILDGGQEMKEYLQGEIKAGRVEIDPATEPKNMSARQRADADAVAAILRKYGFEEKDARILGQLTAAGQREAPFNTRERRLTNQLEQMRKSKKMRADLEAAGIDPERLPTLVRIQDGLYQSKTAPPAPTPEASQEDFLKAVLDRREKGVLDKMPSADALRALGQAAHEGRVVHGKFYRVMDPKEFPKWCQGGAGLPKGALFKWAGPRETVTRSYGQPGLWLVEIDADALPYDPGAKENEVGVIHAYSAKVVDRNLEAEDYSGRIDISEP